MYQFVDYKCKPGADLGGLENEVVKMVNLDFPEGYTTSHGLFKISKASKEYKEMTMCLLPFCHTVEAENYGGDINLGTAKIGPRCKGYVYENIQDLLSLPDLDFKKGRLKEVIKAIKNLKSAGENVVVNITGPITILNNLIDPSKIFKTWRKDPDVITTVIEKLRVQILLYMEKAIESGADVLAFEDPVGALNILGPNYFEMQGRNFSYPFVIDAIKMIGNRAVLHICPKTTLQLISLEFAYWDEIQIDEVMTYEEAYIKLKDKISATGNICIHNRDIPLKNKKLKILKLN
ncbi:MAG: uroporphyrinogen decarboxylase family protein [Senegalia sp. (in: firmicutes)]|uniref:uroporphyrinogen decarboxylase family protein n=1 Tax=Senegalia sp. (in: firmicutes) TaxID=1924098 RepID=UPI003F987F14